MQRISVAIQIAAATEIRQALGMLSLCLALCERVGCGASGEGCVGSRGCDGVASAGQRDVVGRGLV
jgi:hypothetical protein